MPGYTNRLILESKVSLLMRQNSYQAILNLIQQEKDPTAKLLMNKAYCLLKIGYLEKALEVYNALGSERKASNLQTIDAQFTITLRQHIKIIESARNYQSCNMHVEAIQEIQQLDAYAINKEALLILIDSFLACGETVLAVVEANDLLSLFPNDEECLKKACQVAVLNESHNAIEMLKRVAKELTHPQDFLLSMVDSFKKIDSIALAIDASKVILEKFPDNKQNYLKLIECFLLLKDEKQALKYIKISNEKFANDSDFLQEVQLIKEAFPSVLNSQRKTTLHDSIQEVQVTQKAFTSDLNSQRKTTLHDPRSSFSVSRCLSTFYTQGIHLTEKDLRQNRADRDAGRVIEGLDLATPASLPRKIK